MKALRTYMLSRHDCSSQFRQRCLHRGLPYVLRLKQQLSIEYDLHYKRRLSTANPLLRYL